MHSLGQRASLPSFLSPSFLPESPNPVCVCVVAVCVQCVASVPGRSMPSSRLECRSCLLVKRSEGDREGSKSVLQVLVRESRTGMQHSFAGEEGGSWHKKVCAVGRVEGWGSQAEEGERRSEEEAEGRQKKEGGRCGEGNLVPVQ